ncbi:MAG: hypothetical protein WCK49_07000 [Myxococcaceae bacterium]
MKLFLMVFQCFFGVSTLAANSDNSCSSLLSRASRVVLIEPEPESPSGTALPVVVTETTRTATTVSTASSIILSTTQVAQGSRILSLQQMVSCNNNDPTEQTSLSWTDSPTQLSIGNTTQQYNLGAVVGNWAILGGTTACWTALATKLGTEATHYPGALIMPVMFLMSPTTSAAVSLVQQGTTTEQLVGGLSLSVQAIGMGVVAVFLHPTHFGAEWVSNQWTDKNYAGYVKHYGMLFKDYRSGAHAFITAEFLMSMATGLLQSFQSLGNDCRYLITTSAATSTAYALSTVLIRPHQHPHDRIFYGAIASIQAVAINTQAISSWVASEETQQKVRNVTESILTATQWALLAKTVYDLGRYAKTIYDYMRSAPQVKPEIPALLIPETNGPTDDNSDTASIELNAIEPVLEIPTLDKELLPTPSESSVSSQSSSEGFRFRSTELTGDTFGMRKAILDPYTGVEIDTVDL